MQENDKIIFGFSKLSKKGKLDWVADTFFNEPDEAKSELTQFWHSDESQQKILDGFSENTISNFYLPFGVAPNFLINGRPYTIPMVIEESSVVAAASSAAKFWLSRGGFRAEIMSTHKIGQVHFYWSGEKSLLFDHFNELKEQLISNAKPITKNMENRGGGILDIDLLDFTTKEKDYFQIKASFETCDSMGANFINSVLENFAQTLTNFIESHSAFANENGNLNIIMSILSNYTPQCLVRAWVECPVDQLEAVCKGMDADVFADKFHKAIRIAHIDPYRATTHNKGIFNGVDAVVLATGNDFRAVEACGHTYAAKDGSYRSLSHCSLKNGIFKFWMDLPLALGTVGGLTKLHPIARRSLELLGNPSAQELMKIIAVTGLAQNFAAVRSLITTGIQKGHMKMHLLNILNHLDANEWEISAVAHHFKDKTVSFSTVRQFLETIRSKPINKNGATFSQNGHS